MHEGQWWWPLGSTDELFIIESEPTHNSFAKFKPNPPALINELLTLKLRRLHVICLRIKFLIFLGLNFST